MAPFPDDVEDVHDFRFYQGTDDDRFRYAGIRFLRRAQAARQESDAQVGDDGLDHEVPLARFEDDLRLETDFLTVLDDFVVQVEVVAVEDQRFIGQLLEGNRLFLGQDVVPVDDDVHRVLGQEERFKVLFLRLCADDAQVDEAFLDADFDFLRAVFVEVQFNLRVFLLERPQKVGEDRCARDRRQADEDRPLFQLEFVFKVRLQVFEHEDDALGVGEENRAGIGEFDGFGVAHEEDDAQFFFQGLDGAADGGLGNVQRPRGFAE